MSFRDNIFHVFGLIDFGSDICVGINLYYACHYQFAAISFQTEKNFGLTHYCNGILLQTTLQPLLHLTSDFLPSVVTRPWGIIPSPGPLFGRLVIDRHVGFPSPWFTLQFRVPPCVSLVFWVVFIFSLVVGKVSEDVAWFWSIKGTIVWNYHY